jgi:hypothetical protein
MRKEDEEYLYQIEQEELERERNQQAERDYYEQLEQEKNEQERLYNEEQEREYYQQLEYEARRLNQI